VRPSDESFLLSLFRALRAPGYEWSGGHLNMPSTVHLQFKAREQALGSKFPSGDDRVVEFDGAPIGRFWATCDWSAFHVADLSILPEHQRRGVGTKLARDLIEKARGAKLPVLVTVAQPDVKSCRFYQRLGFEVADQNVSYVSLEWRPRDRPE